MSLRAFHILFIFLSILLAAGFAWWAYANGVGQMLATTSAVIAVALTVYGVSFVRKTRKLIL